MALSHGIIALNSSTAVALNTDTVITDPVTGDNHPTWTEATVSVQNLDSAATVYIGAAGVTSSSYGISLSPGAQTVVDNLGPNMVLYAISTASSNVAVLTVAS
jgi:hypothetical protein